MDTNALKKFAQAARNLLIDQVTSKLDLVLAEGAPARREHPRAVKDLENAIRRDGRGQVIEQVAYTWFNRFTALRFMDANGYTQVRVVSPAEGATRPEILTEALAGNMPEGAPGRSALCWRGARPRGIRRPKPTASCWSTPATAGTRTCRSCSRRSTTIPNC